MHEVFSAPARRWNPWGPKRKSAGQTCFKDSAFGEARMTSAVRSVTERTAPIASDWRQRAGCRCVSAGLFVLLPDGAVDGSGGAQAVERSVGRGSEQRDPVRDWGADGAVWVHSGKSVLHRGLSGEPAVVDARGTQRIAGAVGCPGSACARVRRVASSERRRPTGGKRRPSKVFVALSL